MKLFRCDRATVLDEPACAVIATPLGNIELVAQIGHRLVHMEPATSVWAVGETGRIVVWNRPDFRLELLLYQPTVKLFDELCITDTRAAVWRLRARQTVESCLFACRWQPGYRWKESSPDTGEGVYARTWHNRRVEVVIGTEDDDALLWRAEEGDWLPKSWATCFSPWAGGWAPFWDHPAHRPFGSGLSIPLPGLAPTLRCQVHFVVAWAPNCRKTSGAWMATGLPSSNILTQAGCR